MTQQKDNDGIMKGVEVDNTAKSSDDQKFLCPTIPYVDMSSIVIYLENKLNESTSKLNDDIGKLMNKSEIIEDIVGQIYSELKNTAHISLENKLNESTSKLNDDIGKLMNKNEIIEDIVGQIYSALKNTAHISIDRRSIFELVDSIYAIENIIKGSEPPHDKKLENIRAVCRKISNALEESEITYFVPEIGAIYNTEEQEAKGSEENLKYKETSIVKVILPGCRYGETLIRPAQVIISESHEKGR